MLLFKKLRLKNFLSYGNSSTEIILNEKATTLLVGSSGSGKSVLTDAICFTLYGKPFRPINKPQLVNNINKSNCLCELEFDVGSNEYLIRRGIKPTTFEIFCNGTLLNQDSHSKDYQEYLENSVLKMNFKTFSHIVVLGAVNFTPFMQLKPQDRRELIEDLLDIQIFSVMSVILKEKFTQIKNDIAENATSITSCKSKIDLYKKYLENLKQDKQNQINDNKEKISSVLNDIKNDQEKISELQTKIDILKSDIVDESDNTDKLTKLNEFKRDLTYQLSQATKAKETHAANIKKFEQTNSEIEKDKQLLEAINKTIEKLSEQIKDKDIITTKFEESKDTIKDLSYKVKAVNKDLEFYSSHNECPTCKRDFESDYKTDLINTKTKEKEEFDKLLIQSTEENQKHYDMLAAMAKIKCALDANVTTQKSLASNIDLNTKYSLKIKAEIDEYKLDDSNEEKLNEKLKKIVDTLPKFESIQKEIKEVHSKINLVVEDINKLKANISSSEKYMKKIEDENIELEKETSRGEEEAKLLNSSKEEYKGLEQSKESLLKDRHVTELAIGILKDGGIKTRIIKQYIPIINSLVNRFLDSMQFNINFSMNETFEETIRVKGRDELTYSSLSDGERQRLDIAILLTWRTIATMKNSIKTNLLFIDELLDSFLDSDSAENIIGLISKEPILKDSNVFVVSHKGTLTDKFTNVISFMKVNNFSKVV